MKLSRALLIVLVLHIVAVAGIVAFNTIKTRENLASTTPEAIAPPVAQNSSVPTAEAASTPALPNETAKTRAPSAPKTVAKEAAPEQSSVKDSGKIYTVVKGDNPVTIARHLKVSEADLLELNQITDPRKLQINQKLRIPERTVSSKSKSD